MNPMRVVVVDDSAFMRRAISQMLASDQRIEVVATGRNGREAIELARQHRPDVLTLDIEMPEMDGLTALRRIMRECPTQVLMLSSLTTEGSRTALQAMSLGAADVLAKDASQITLSIDSIRNDLIARVIALGHAGKTRRTQFGTSIQPASTALPVISKNIDVICIGSSTGGPPVLETILTALPAELTVPIVIAQHMPATFTASMAERLDQICRLKVVHAADGMPLERRTVYIAPGGKHTHIRKVSLARWRLQVNHEPADALYRPSADALFTSAAQAMGSRVLAIVLTGMGHDGLEGSKVLHKHGATVLAQSEETCVVYGMPKAVTEHALIAASLSPSAIAQCIRTIGLQEVPAKSGYSAA